MFSAKWAGSTTIPPLRLANLTHRKNAINIDTAGLDPGSKNARQLFIGINQRGQRAQIL